MSSSSAVYGGAESSARGVSCVSANAYLPAWIAPIKERRVLYLPLLTACAQALSLAVRVCPRSVLDFGAGFPAPFFVLDADDVICFVFTIELTSSYTNRSTV